jgi:hypothetical protein
MELEVKSTPTQQDKRAMNTALKTAFTLSIPVAVLAVVQSAGGLFFPGLYRDIPLVTAAMKGNDVVTLALVSPLLIWSLIAVRRGSPPAQLVWIGCLGYMVYNYFYYLFGIAFNRFFLIYAAVFVCSFYAFIYALSGLDAANIAQKFAKNAPVRWIAVFMLFIGGLLGVVEMSQVLGYLFKGELPQAIAQFGDNDAPAVIFAADLTLVIPAFALASVWIWRRRPWGYLLTAVMLVKAFTYGLALIGMVLFAWTTLGAWDALMPFYLFIAVGGLTFLLIFLKNINRYKSL